MCTLTNQISYHILHYCSQISTLDSLHIVKGRVTGRKLNSTRPPLKWSPGHIQKGEAMIFIWKTQVRSAGFEPRMPARLAKQSGALPMRDLSIYKSNLAGYRERFFCSFESLSTVCDTGPTVKQYLMNLSCMVDIWYVYFWQDVSAIWRRTRVAWWL